MDISALYQIYLQYPSIQTDTRKLKKGDLFFALKGENFNGNQFAQYALDNGASFAIVDEVSPSLMGNDQVILVTDVLTTLQALANYHRTQFTIPFIAITGSNGKTTTKELLAAVLSQKYNTYATAGNLNNHIGVPLTILSIPSNAEMAIIEMGANHLGEIASYCTIAMPNFGIINNCGKAHLEGFGSIEGVKKAKGELYNYIKAINGTIFINNDLEYLQEMSVGIPNKITYGTTNSSIIGKDISDSALLKLAILTSGLETSIQTQLIGGYNLPNVLVAITVGNYFNVPIELMKAALENYEPTNSRSQLLKTALGNEIILDAYNANPSSMELAIKNLAKMDGNDKWLLLGAMKEMGNESQTEHQKIINLCQELGFQNVLLVGHEYKVNAIPSNFQLFESTNSLNAYLQQHLLKHKLILIKGSRGSKMELALPYL